jgi:hypothetical protein
MTEELVVSRAGSDAGYALRTDGGVLLSGQTVTSPFTQYLSIPTDVTVTKVKWYVDNFYIGVTETEPWSWVGWVNEGPRVLRAKATLSDGTTKQAVASVTAQRCARPLPRPPRPQLPDGLTEVNVSTAAELTAALAAAEPGQRIVLADGSYVGNFVLSGVHTTSDAPVVVEGSRDAVLSSPSGFDGGSYGFYLEDCTGVWLSGFTIRDAKKGLVLDFCEECVVLGLAIREVGQEGLHLRRLTSRCWVEWNLIDGTGRANAGFGEGIYVGSAVGNWPFYTDGEPDTCDKNAVRFNVIWNARAECVDIKEGTSGGELSGNTFDGSAIAGENSADSYVDVKGSRWLVAQNLGSSSPGNGIEVHVPVLGDGVGNWFEYNQLGVPATATGIWLDGTASHTGNVVLCSNDVSGSATLTLPNPCLP